jgi:hypothetical protein
MTTAEIINTLKNEGFQTETAENGAIVSLASRQLSMLEVEIALNFQVDRKHFIRMNSSKILIIGIAQ